MIRLEFHRLEECGGDFFFFTMEQPAGQGFLHSDAAHGHPVCAVNRSQVSVLSYETVKFSDTDCFMSSLPHAYLRIRAYDSLGPIVLFCFFIVISKIISSSSSKFIEQ